MHITLEYCFLMKLWYARTRVCCCCCNAAASCVGVVPWVYMSRVTRQKRKGIERAWWNFSARMWYICICIHVSVCNRRSSLSWDFSRRRNDWLISIPVHVSAKPAGACPRVLKGDRCCRHAKLQSGRYTDLLLSSLLMPITKMHSCKKVWVTFGEQGT